MIYTTVLYSIQYTVQYTDYTVDDNVHPESQLQPPGLYKTRHGNKQLNIQKYV